MMTLHHMILHINEATEAEYQWELEPIKDTPYLALTGVLRTIFCNHFGVNWMCYNGTALYSKAHVGWVTDMYWLGK